MAILAFLTPAAPVAPAAPGYGPGATQTIARTIGGRGPQAPFLCDLATNIWN